MKSSVSGTSIGRRRMLTMTGKVATAISAATIFGSVPAHADAVWDNEDWMPDAADQATFSQIESIVQAQGMFMNGVYSIEIDRTDINNVTLNGVPILPSFEINGTLYFQKLKDGSWILNADFPLQSSEVNPFIDQLIGHNIVFQAQHQHFYDFTPEVWFIHFRQQGDPIQIAYNVQAALSVVPQSIFPQMLPSNPSTPLPADTLGQIVGASPTIGSDGVVNFDVPRANRIRLGGVRISPYLNIAHVISFQPYGGGENAAGVIDFSLIASEINPVMKVMRSQRWDIGCLYNQETDEYPQLYFSHQFKVGDAIELAKEMRSGMNLTLSQFMSS